MAEIITFSTDADCTAPFRRVSSGSNTFPSTTNVSALRRLAYNLILQHNGGTTTDSSQETGKMMEIRMVSRALRNMQKNDQAQLGQGFQDEEVYLKFDIAKGIDEIQEIKRGFGVSGEEYGFKTWTPGNNS